MASGSGDKVVFKEYTKRSKDKLSVWQHFLRSESGSQAKCKICKVVLSNSKATTPLNTHLQKKHSKFVKGQINNSDGVTVTASGSNQNTNDEVYVEEEKATSNLKIALKK